MKVSCGKCISVSVSGLFSFSSYEDSFSMSMLIKIANGLLVLLEGHYIGNV